jgi:hypothetical protein
MSSGVMHPSSSSSHSSKSNFNFFSYTILANKHNAIIKSRITISLSDVIVVFSLDPSNLNGLNLSNRAWIKLSAGLFLTKFSFKNLYNSEYVTALSVSVVFSFFNEVANYLMLSEFNCA